MLPEQHRKTVIRMNGDVAQTFLVDGFVAGTWRAENGRIVLEPFSSPSPAIRRELEDEAAAPGGVPHRLTCGTASLLASWVPGG